MDMIEKDFRPGYEAICVGNKPADAQHVFFEGLLLKEGLGTLVNCSFSRPQGSQVLLTLADRS